MNKKTQTGLIFYALSIAFTIFLFSPTLFFSRSMAYEPTPWMPILLIGGTFLLGTLMFWIGRRENWLRKNGIKAVGEIIKFQTMSTPHVAGEFINTKCIMAEAIIEGKRFSFLSGGLHPKEEYKMPKIGDPIDVYYKLGNPQIYYVDIKLLKRSI